MIFGQPVAQIEYARRAETRGFSESAGYLAGRIAQVEFRLFSQPFTTGEAKRKARVELSSIQEDCKQSNWDGFGAEAVESVTIDLANSYLDALPRNLPTPEVGVEPDGQVTFEWYRSPRRVLSVSISPCGDLHYAALIGARKEFGTIPFLREAPSSINELVGQVLG